ncbi:hypothetical protein ACFQ6N_12360 [Kitasatospora sp. NPDC056446]|uniref:hypothetical protein n=1 Tax=Kitasatospora sp. NPDC056446 TaxID=3345819 RepID=UPI003687FA22
MTLKTTRRAAAVRSLAGTVLTAALLVPAATACSSSSDTHGSAAPTSAATTVPTTPPAAAPDASGSGAPATAPGAAPTTAPGTNAGAPPTAKPTARTTTAPAGAAKPGSPARTQTLPDGSTVEIQETSPQNYRAKIIHSGQVLGTLETKDADTGVDFNDMFVTLSTDGQVHAWMGGAHQGPGTFSLPGGWTAKVTKVGELHFRAQITGQPGADSDTLEANQHDVAANANGVYIVLSAGGRISAHM